MKKSPMFGPSSILAFALLSIAALVVTPRLAGAYGYEGVGGKLGYSSGENLDGTAALSVHTEFAQDGSRLHMLPNVTYWRVDGVRDLSPNFDLYYHFAPEGQVTPYVGGGMGINFMRNDRRDVSDAQLGVNMLGGVRFPGTSHSYFLEGRYTASDVPQAMVMAGVTFKNH